MKPLIQLFFILIITFSPLLVANQEVKLNDIYLQLSLIEKEVGLIRREMGRSKTLAQKLPVLGVTLQESWFQALTLYKKSDQLAFELTRKRFIEPALPNGEIIPDDVLKVVNEALSRIREAKKTLNIQETVAEPIKQSEKKPADIFAMILMLNRQLNKLIDHQFTPSHVYQLVTSSIQHAAALLREHPEIMIRVPETAKYERFKEPIDVYRRLIHCLMLLRTIYQNFGLASLSLNPGAIGDVVLEPSDVYDIAAVVLAQLDFLVRRQEININITGYYPGYKIPSDVYQRVGILEEQLRLLSQYSNSNLQ